MRYDKTERLGVIETDKIITKDIGWIFREQPIIDVGLDAIIEAVENDEPTGKFIALQIKTGPGNFYRTDKTLTHYVSHIHYNYWLNLSIPIILVAHLPSQEETYWQEINKSNFKKNKKQWKIEIPLSQKLNEKSTDRLKKLLSVHNDKNFNPYIGGDSEDEYSLFEDIKCIQEATKSLNRITEITKDQTEVTLAFNEKIRLFTTSGIFINDPQVSSLFKGFTNSLLITAKRMENEIEIFSNLYSIGIFAFEKIILKLHYHGISLKDLAIKPETIKEVIPMIDFAYDSYLGVKQTATEMNINSPGFKEAKNQYVEVIDLLCSELLASKIITINLVEKI